MRTELSGDSFTNTLQIANNATHIVNNKRKIGSVIDIDTNKHYDGEEFLINYTSEIEEAHFKEKQLFYTLLKPSFLKSYN